VGFEPNTREITNSIARPRIEFAPANLIGSFGQQPLHVCGIVQRPVGGVGGQDGNVAATLFAALDLGFMAFSGRFGIVKKAI
jgi:hypothetical protein